LVLRMNSGRVPQILTVERQDAEGVELHLLIVPARVQGVEVGDAIGAEDHGTPSMTNCRCRFFSALSTIHGKRCEVVRVASD
jgi:hypothetical protein